MTENPMSNASRYCRLGLVCCVAVAVYILSLGPAIKLTTTLKGAGYERPARLPSMAHATQVAYSPLFGVLGGDAGSVPRNALNWYVGLWTREPDTFSVDPNQFQQAVNQTVEPLRKTRNEHQ